MKIDTTNFTDKASKEERFLTLYENHDYITAYSKHTDIRVADDPLWSIGRGDEWESHGNLQRDFLISNGMTPESLVLDLGCGIGRAARKIVPYLNNGGYTGVDISPAALDYARKLSIEEGWASKSPNFFLSDGLSLPVSEKFDIVWAHSVFTHLPEDAIRALTENIKGVLSETGKFLFTYKQSEKPRRSGLKQFQYPFQFFAEVAESVGLQARFIDKTFPASQRTIEVLWGDTAIIHK